MLRQRQRKSALCVRVLRAACAFVGLTVGACGKKDAAAPTTSDWNVLLVTFDTTRADHLSCYGYTAIRTPTIDALAERGVRYTRCYSSAPITLPSHATILTGMYPFYHGLRDNGTGPLEERFTTLAEVLAGRGYRTGAFVGAYVLHSRFGLKQGFQTYDDDFSGGSRISKLAIPERNGQAVTDAALHWLAQPSTSPYFMWVHYFDPHMPYSPPGLAPNTPNTIAYDQELIYADSQLGRLVRRVDELEKQTGRPTLIVFTADHGESLMDHGEPTHAYFVYEPTMRVPLVVIAPKNVSHGAPPARSSVAETGVIDAPVALVDIFPSILHWLSISTPYEMPGRPLPKPGDPVTSERRPLYFETRMPFHTYGWSPLEGIVAGSFKYIHAPIPELYDLARDPKETRNLFTPENLDAIAMNQALRALQSATLNAPPPALARTATDDASRRALRALGYAGSVETLPEDITALRDPKNMLEWHVRGAADAALKLDAGHAVESAPILADALRADPDNRWVLSLLSELLDRPETYEAALAIAQERVKAPLPPPHDRRLPASLALSLARNGRAPEAVDLLKPLVAKMSDSAELHFSLGASYLEAREQDAGVIELRRAMEIDPAHRPTRILLGDTLFVQAMSRSDSDAARQKFASAAEHYRAALVAADEAAPPPHIEGVSLHEMPSVPLVAPGVSVAQLRVKLAATLHRLGQAQDALNELRAALETDANLFEAHTDLAELLLESKNVPEAEAHYREAVRIKPDDADARYNLGGLYLQTNRPKEAIEPLREAVRLKPDHGQAVINLGIALYRAGQTEEAKSLFRRAIEMPTSAAEGCHSLGIALSKEGNTADAVASFERAIALNPTYTAPIEELVGFYLREHRTGDAVRVLRSAVSVMPGNVRYLNVLAQILATTPDDMIRNGAEAVDLARRADQLSGGQHPAILGTLAAALAETGDYDQAIAIVDRAVAAVEKIPPPQSGAANPTPLLDQLRAQLAQYRARKPFRDPRY